MAMISDTGSSFEHWAALYNSHHDDPAAVGPVLSDNDAGIGTGAGTTAASPTSGGSSGGSPTPTKAAGAQRQQLHGVEGPRRIGKPAAATAARRRSRASRRAPVTLLNTDTANFRAMVQQFTGIPAPPAGAAFGVGVGNHPLINFAAADYGFPPHPSSAVSMSFNHHHQIHQPAPTTLQEQQLRRQQQQQYTGGASSLFGYGGGSGLLHGGGDVFASHGFPAASAAEDRMLLQSIQAAQQMPSSHMQAPVSAANTTANGFFA